MTQAQQTPNCLHRLMLGTDMMYTCNDNIIHFLSLTEEKKLYGILPINYSDFSKFY